VLERDPTDAKKLKQNQANHVSQSIYVYLVIGMAFVAANLPFLAFNTLRNRPTSLALRLIALLLAYFIVGGIGFAIESHLGKTTGQGWEFYAITFALFLTFAFPGFIYRYLLRHK
jgi:heme/copper-type cytochrome/quinol oxidase subunit 4